MLKIDENIISAEDLVNRVRSQLAINSGTENFISTHNSVSTNIMTKFKPLQKDIGQLQTNATIYEPQITVYRKSLSPMIIFFKRLIRKAIWWYVEPKWSQQQSFNKLTAKVLTDLLKTNQVLYQHLVNVDNKIEDVKFKDHNDQEQELLNLVSSINSNLSKLVKH